MVVHIGPEDKIFEDEWGAQRGRGALPEEDALWIGHTDFVLSESVQKSKPSPPDEQAEISR